ncbi:MAG: TIGR02449 family protein [Sinobacterium sp.]|jgi:cell division protein ZapB|tara:strand:- start:103 stop:312 length:210 start_codon:yes stop_codon:yes gene_type:complete
MENPKFIELESKIDALIEVCEELHRENEMLKSTQGAWQRERAQLREKNEQARTRVEAMIARLKSLEKEV